ncbi:MAG: RsmD family RNA methyltransferase, partial [Phycisphaeraceae bacterium]|nr:RsmD family RNA methyltransferase [Phycisphaeraceae bacterium]
THRGRPIVPPRGTDVTRPITDRVKQAMFDRLWAMQVFDEVEPADGETGVALNVLDVFAGTGSLGLEALSRGATHCTFVERNRDALGKLQHNLDTLALTGQAAVLKSDVVAGNWTHLAPRKPIGLLFVDPPYAMTDEAEAQSRICTIAQQVAAISAPLATMMIRTRAAVTAPPVEPWITLETCPYGSTALHLYQLPDV